MSMPSYPLVILEELRDWRIMKHAVQSIHGIPIFSNIATNKEPIIATNLDAPLLTVQPLCPLADINHLDSMRQHESDIPPSHSILLPKRIDRLLCLLSSCNLFYETILCYRAHTSPVDLPLDIYSMHVCILSILSMRDAMCCLTR